MYFLQRSIEINDNSIIIPSENIYSPLKNAWQQVIPKAPETNHSGKYFLNFRSVIVAVSNAICKK